MTEYIIAIGTVTYALKGRDLLRKAGYSAFVKRLSAGTKEYGCGYVITFKGNIENAKAILKENGIRVLKVEKT